MHEKNPINYGCRGGTPSNNRGFSLVELLVVVAIFGVISTVVLDLYVNVLRSTTSSEEVVEVQQGMRIALEEMARDIQMAGFMVPTGIPITDARNNLLTLTTASAFRTFARIETTATFAVGATTAVPITVGSAAMARLFKIGDFVRIVSPATGLLAGGVPIVSFQITGVSPSVPSLELTPVPVNPPAPAIIVANADMIVRIPSPGQDPTFPNAVTYMLEDDPVSADPNMRVLSRIWRAGLPALSPSDRVLATKITGLRFEYLMKDGTVAFDPASAAGTAVATAQLVNIVGVRIFLTGLAEEGNPRAKTLQTTVKIRNI